MFNYVIALTLSGLLLAAPAWAQTPTPAPAPAIELNPAQLESIRLAEIIRAAQLYTGIAFSAQNQQKMREKLPLAPQAFTDAIAVLKERFESCVESGLEARLPDAYQAQVLRKTMQSAVSKNVPEPKDAQVAMPAFNGTNAYCSSRIEAWMAASLH